METDWARVKKRERETLRLVVRKDAEIRGRGVRERWVPDGGGFEEPTKDLFK